jgi:hypothetical protein
MGAWRGRAFESLVGETHGMFKGLFRIKKD